MAAVKQEPLDAVHASPEAAALARMRAGCITIVGHQNDEVHMSSLTRKYVVSWTAQHAFRELVQNQVDGIASTFGVEIDDVVGEFDEATGLGELKIADGRRVGSISIGSDEVVLEQSHCILSSEHLLLGSSKDKRYGGGFGEGFKVGILVLLQKGYRVTYEMETERWTFGFAGECEQMCVKAERMPAGTPPNLRIVVQGPGAAGLFQPWRLLAFRQLALGVRKLPAADNGAVLMVHKDAVAAAANVTIECKEDEDEEEEEEEGEDEDRFAIRKAAIADENEKNPTGLVYYKGIVVCQDPLFRALGMDICLPPDAEVTRDRNHIVGGVGGWFREALADGITGEAWFADMIMELCKTSPSAAHMLMRYLEVETAMLKVAAKRVGANLSDCVFSHAMWTPDKCDALQKLGYVLVDGGPHVPVKANYNSLVMQRIAKYRVDQKTLDAKQMAVVSKVCVLASFARRVIALYYPTLSGQASCALFDTNIMRSVSTNKLMVLLNMSAFDLSWSSLSYVVTNGMAQEYPAAAFALHAMYNDAVANPLTYAQMGDAAFQDKYSPPQMVLNPAAKRPHDAISGTLNVYGTDVRAPFGLGCGTYTPVTLAGGEKVYVQNGAAPLQPADYAALSNAIHTVHTVLITHVKNVVQFNMPVVYVMRTQDDCAAFVFENTLCVNVCPRHSNTLMGMSARNDTSGPMAAVICAMARWDANLVASKFAAHIIRAQGAQSQALL